MKKKLFSEIPHLKSDRLLLQGLTPEDAPALQELVDSPGVYRYLPTFLFRLEKPPAKPGEKKLKAMDR